MATVAPASAVPVRMGWVTLVMLSVLEDPLSDPATMSGVDGTLAVPITPAVLVAKPAVPRVCWM